MANNTDRKPICPYADIAENLESKNEIIHAGQRVYDITNKKFKTGDGVTAWNDLPYDSNSGSGGGNVDLSDYYTKEETDDLFEEKADVDELVGKYHINENGDIGTGVEFGEDTTATGDCSHAEGFETTASGEYSHAEGFGTTASEYASHAEGYSTYALKEASHAEGYGTYATGDYSHAEGSGTMASKEASHAEGSYTQALGSYSHTEGRYTHATEDNQHVQGRFNYLDSNSSSGNYAHIVGNGTDDDNRSNAHTLDWNGNAWFKGDVLVGGSNQDDETAISLRAIAEYNNTVNESVQKLQNGESFEKGAIKPESTSFFDFIYSGNLFNPDDTVSGYINDKGEISANSSYITTNYIPIKEGQTLRRQFDSGNNRFDNETVSTLYGKMRMCAFGADKKVIEYQQDLKFWTMPQGTEYVRVSMTTNALPYNVALIISDSSEVVPFEPFGTVAGAHLKTEYMPNEAINAFMPKDIYCAVGRTIEIYNNQVCPAANDSLYFKWDCKAGKALKRKFSIEGTESVIGDYALNLTIYNASMDILWSGSSTLHIVEDNISDLSICAIGDSLTNQKAWLPELINLNNGISFVGTRSFSLKDSDDVTRNGSHEGRSGWTAARYNLAGDTNPSESGFKYENPFFDGSGFNWSYYVTNSLGGVSPDVVVIFLGTNGITLDPTSNGNAIKLLVDRIRKDNTTIPIFVVNTLYKSNQNGIGKQTGSDGYSTYKGQYKYEEDMKIFNLMEYLNGILESYTNVYTVPVSLCHDSEYNYGQTEVSVNPRSTVMEKHPIESVHPQKEGYYQIADILYSVLCATIDKE